MNHEDIDPAVAPSGTGCADCDANDPAGWWVHLRRCARCGHIGCCDTSPAQHATAHATETGHRFIQTFEPDEDWFYNYETGEVLDGPELAPPNSRPDEQPVPGPAERVPADWMEHIHR
jgi:Zn ribbon nucleic-acid-binding protein